MTRVVDELVAVGAILVEDRLLRRVIKRHRHLSSAGLQVPHAHGYALTRDDLAPLLAPGELAVELSRLPDRVAVITGDLALLAADDPMAWTNAWRAIFHARVHDVFDDLLARKVLTAAAIRERIHDIGQIEFDEIRLVLRQEDLLLPPGDDATAYAEFVALFLELRSFAPDTMAHSFSTLGDPARIDAIVARDVDADALLAAARPAPAPLRPRRDEAGAPAGGAPLPSPRVLGAGRQAARRAAEAARLRGNRVRAAILACRADEPEVARADLDELVTRLARALGGAPSAGWVDALLPVAVAAAGQRVLRYTATARLLLDLQAACHDAERELEVVDAIAWARSLGKRSIVRTLPATREVRVARHLHAAARKLPSCDLTSSVERDRLATAIHAMVERADQSVRVVLRPTIETAFAEVGLVPRQLPERVALKKIVDELLDDAVKVGRLSLGNLRDAIAHNDLKLSSLRPLQLVSGDQLLRIDRQLTESLEGVYRRGEVYLRFLQKVSSVLSGNVLGRLLTLYVLLPVVGSFFVVEGLHHMVAPIATWTDRVEPAIAIRPVFIAVGVLIFLLLHATWFRSALVAALRGAWRVLVAVVGRVAGWLARVPLLRPLIRRVLVPAAPAVIAALLIDGPARIPIVVALFVAAAALVNSRVAEEVFSDWLVRSGRHLTRRILPGLIKYSLDAFAWLLELVERGIYRVDERLRFRPNQSTAIAVVKGVLGTIWFVVSYALRIYVNLLVEPTVNPIKHFPVVTVAAKLILPLTPQMVTAIAGPAGGVLGPTLGASFAAFTVLVLPGIAGFLAWELNSNWKLYARNRRAELGDVAIGSHGETMGSLLRLGFHSGTVPKLHARLRRATWKGNLRAIASCKESLHHVEEALWKFADRQLASMLNEDVTFGAVDVGVGHVEVGTNRLRIEITCPSLAPAAAVLCFEEQSGWVVASIPEPGWIDVLADDQRRTLEVALIGFYKLAGVDLVREQLESVLEAGGLPSPTYDIADEGVVVWPGPGMELEIIYALGSSTMRATIRGGSVAGEMPSFAGRAARFGREPVAWSAWATTWERLSFGMEPARLIAGPSLLPAPPRSAP